MKRMGIEAFYRKPNTPKPAPGHRIYPYLLRKLPITRPNQVWAMDITYIPLLADLPCKSPAGQWMARGFIHLAAVLDWFTRRVLAWRVSITLEADFCIEAVEEALAKYGRPEIFNSDQGSLGGLNRSSQRFGDGGCDGGTETRGGLALEGAYAVAWATGCGEAGRSASVLASDRGGPDQRGCGTGRGRGPCGRVAVVQGGGRYATIASGVVGTTALGTVPVV